jgi:hypothetical protein
LAALVAAVSVWSVHATQTALAQASLKEHQQKVRDEILPALECIEKSLISRAAAVKADLDTTA